jgi:hypothetical protein
MASLRSGRTSEGTLYEAYARGNKDTFFFVQDEDLSGASGVNPFETRYERVPPVIHELRRIPPLNGAEFGRSCEFELEVAGDIFLNLTLLIDLPTWLPAQYAAINPYTLATDLSGVSYGYTNGIGYFLFSKIQLYQDKILLDEYSGDALFASRAARGSLNSAYLENTLGGFHDGTIPSISASATPGRLRLELPFFGGKKYGFPSGTMRKQSFKLRCVLRTLEDLVESSSSVTGGAAPAPWNIKFLRSATTPPKIFTPLPRIAIDSPTIQLETRHLYTDNESQAALQKADLELPFSRLYENNFTFGANDYKPLITGSTAAVTRRLDAQHPAARLLWFFRSQNDIRSNKLWKFTADISGQEYYLNQSLIIAGRDRETLFSPLIWNAITHLAKEDRDPGAGIGEMNWGLGAVLGRTLPFERQPEGSVNFTTADRPTLYTELAEVPIDTRMMRPNTEMTAIVDSWSIYTIEKDRGFFRYSN